MPLNYIPIAENELTENYQYWLQKWDPLEIPDQNLNSVFTELLPTHTFGFVKTVGNIMTYPYRKIFGLDSEPPEGLLSDAYREAHNLYSENEIKRSMNIAREFGLDSYVFGYLSIHDPYYGRSEPSDVDLCPRPFGIFINKSTEKLPYCLPSRRDLNIYNNAKRDELKKEFLHPKESRSFGAHQVKNDKEHGNDFWHYYGSPEYCKVEEYNENAWKKRLEYHYFEKIDVADISTVLWPIWYRNALGPNLQERDKSYYAIQQININLPSILIIPYELDETNPEMCFNEASYFVTKYLLDFKMFPLSVEIAKEEYK